ncbi:MAG: ABC transporter permease [Bacteroidetes bacterium]|nr:ABC transporter permease [Bacteroidota bacterium]MCW5894774.1 ABC transporter permease [Bacteroidota bacterium]
MNSYPNILPIFKRELKSYFNSPVAYVVIVVFLAILGWFFSTNLFLNNVASLYIIFDSPLVKILFLVIAPAITMRLLAEERKSGTVELLTTKPVKDVEIIIGKFLAAWVVLGAALLPTLLYVITMAILGSIDFGQVVTGYIGLMLMGGVFIALGLLASSLTDNQIVAFIMGFILAFAVFMLDKVLIYLPSFMASTLEFVGVDFHYSGIARGVIDSRNIIYFASMLGFLLMMATVSLERRKW